jgi:hypothetical protein
MHRTLLRGRFDAVLKFGKLTNYNAYVLYVFCCMSLILKKWMWNLFFPWSRSFVRTEKGQNWEPYSQAIEPLRCQTKFLNPLNSSAVMHVSVGRGAPEKKITNSNAGLANFNPLERHTIRYGLTWRPRVYTCNEKPWWGWGGRNLLEGSCLQTKSSAKSMVEWRGSWPY